MLGLTTNILMVQHFPGVDDYLVYRAGGTTELHHGGPAISDSDFYQYAVSCHAAGQFKATSFPAVVSQAGTLKTVPCKQVIYSTMFKDSGPAEGVNKAVQGAKNALSFLQGGVNWVRWCPILYELSINAGVLPATKVCRIHSLSEAPEEIADYIRGCYDKGGVALKRDYSRPVSTGRATHVINVTEYYFATAKVHKDFQGNTVLSIDPEEYEELWSQVTQHKED